jgi:hypothetical protein
MAITTHRLVLAAGLAAAGVASPVMAAQEAPVAINKCAKSLGTVAVVEGDTQGWTKFGLASPRELIAALAAESGCFTIAANGAPAGFLLNVIAGDKEEVDKGVEMAKAAAVEGLVRSGVASSLIGGVPGGGAIMGMFGGLGGKKKTVAAGIRVISPSNGQTLVTGSGEVKKSTISFGGSGALDTGAQAAGYAGNANGKMLAEAFIKAFNAVTAQGSALAAMPSAQAATTPATLAGATVAVDTRMFAKPDAMSAVVRALRAATTLAPTGKREGLFIEVKDNFGTTGWVSVEDMR